MKILAISNYYPEHTGGIEIVAHNLVNRWRNHHEVRWIACDVDLNPHTIAPGDIPLRALNFAEEHLGFPYPIPSPYAIPQIFKCVQWCDLIHINDCLYLTSIYAYLASRRYHKPLVVTQHVGLIPYAQAYKYLLQKGAYATIGKMVIKNAEGVVFISEQVRNWFEGHIAHRESARLIPNGVDRSLFYPGDEYSYHSNRTNLGYSNGQVLALFVGRFTEKKGLHLIHNIAKSHPQLFWLMIGNGDIDPNRWGLSNVKVLPPQPHTSLRDFYIAADIFVLPSIGEGFPLVVQEALSCGLPAAISKEITAYIPNAPVISLDVFDMSNLIITLDTVLADHELLTTLRIHSVVYAQQWDWNNVASEYELLFEKIQKESSCFL